VQGEQLELLPLWIVLGLIVVVLLFVWTTYNTLTKLSLRIDEAWSNISVQLKRRADLIPNLVKTVKGYAAHEGRVFSEVSAARVQVAQALLQRPTATTEAKGQFESALRSLLAVAEGYPELKANHNFLQLQEELVVTEDRIQAARRFYNSGVRALNTKIQVFPTNIVAGILGFTPREFFEVADGDTGERPVDVIF